jgi:hypothetical protein
MQTTKTSCLWPKLSERKYTWDWWVGDVCSKTRWVCSDEGTVRRKKHHLEWEVWRDHLGSWKRAKGIKDVVAGICGIWV